MQENLWVQIFWVACVGTAIVASVLATWSRRARYIGRVAVGVLMLLGGAVFKRGEPGPGGRLCRLR
jgi:hypothetical protein